jgi:hypothetical protein
MRGIGQLVSIVGLLAAYSTGCGSDKNAPQAQAGTAGASAIGGTGGTVTIPTGGTTTDAKGGTTAVTGGKVDKGGSGAVKGGAGGSSGATGQAGKGNAGAGAGAGGASGGKGAGTCCPDGNCLCHGEAPSALTTENGPYTYESYDLSGVGCVYYPTNAEAPFAAVAIADGFGGSGGCSAMAQTSGWGPLYASWGIVAMIVNTGAGDQPNVRGDKELGGIEGFKAENTKSGSPLFGKLSGRYGTSGFSMGGGGTTMAAAKNSSLKTSVAIMPWTPVGEGVTVPTLVICGSSDTLAVCGTHGQPAYEAMPTTTPKMLVFVASAHMGQPTVDSGKSGAWGIAFQKVFLEGDERWRKVLLSGDYQDTNIK